MTALSPQTSDQFLQILKEALSRHSPSPIVDGGNHRVRAAVLVPLCQTNNTWHVLFIRRSQNVPHHKGQIAFPGGAVEKTDSSPLCTALREAREEIGLSPEAVEILGPLDDQTTVSSGFLIHPFVGIVPSQYPFKQNNDEVSGLLLVPVRCFIEQSPRPKKPAMRGSYPEPVFLYKHEVIWGATARIMANLMEILRGVDPRL